MPTVSRAVVLTPSESAGAWPGPTCPTSALTLACQPQPWGWWLILYSVLFQIQALLLNLPNFDSLICKMGIQMPVQLLCKIVLESCKRWSRCCVISGTCRVGTAIILLCTDCSQRLGVRQYHGAPWEKRVGTRVLWWVALCPPPKDILT